MPAPPKPIGLSDDELRRIDRQCIAGVCLCYSPFAIGLLLAALFGWHI